MTDDLNYIKEGVTKLKCSFANNPRSKEDSIALLKKYQSIFSKSFEPIANAIKSDFNKPSLEVYITEFAQASGEISYFIDNLDALLSSPQPATVPISTSTLSSDIQKIALGTVLIISPFNYPLILASSPFVGAIASGNNVVLKLPFDQLPEFSTVMKNIIETAFPNNEVMVVNGGIPETQFLLNECKFDKIFFTGSTFVGKIVYEAASKNLTPVVLELGGKSPVFITSNINKKSMQIILDRLLWGKFTNAGQTCVAPDYVLIEEAVYDDVIQTISQIYKERYSQIDAKSDFSHIVNERGFKRLTSLIENTKGTVILGGDSDINELFIKPTVITDVDWDDRLMESEIFGPILPILRYNEPFDTIVKKVASKHDCPLAAYLLSSDDSDISTLKKYLRSGSILVNETLMSAGNTATPFGGIGSSGFGNYHSKWSIASFTHERAILNQPIWAETLIKSRYYPYTNKNMKTLQLLKYVPDIPLKMLKDSLFFLLIFALGYLVGKYF